MSSSYCSSSTKYCFSSNADCILELRAVIRVLAYDLPTSWHRIVWRILLHAVRASESIAGSIKQKRIEIIMKQSMPCDWCVETYIVRDELCSDVNTKHDGNGFGFSFK